MNLKNKSCISCANLRSCNVTNIFKWDNIFSNNKRCNLITYFKKKNEHIKHIMKLMPKMAVAESWFKRSFFLTF